MISVKMLTNLAQPLKNRWIHIPKSPKSWHLARLVLDIVRGRVSATSKAYGGSIAVSRRAQRTII